jgi:hypothetical protein
LLGLLICQVANQTQLTGTLTETSVGSPPEPAVGQPEEENLNPCNTGRAHQGGHTSLRVREGGESQFRRRATLWYSLYVRTLCNKLFAKKV